MTARHYFLLVDIRISSQDVDFDAKISILWGINPLKLAMDLHYYALGLVVRGKHWLQFEIGGDAPAAQRHRFKAQELFMDSILSFIPTTLSYEEWHSKFNMYFSAFEAQCDILL